MANPCMIQHKHVAHTPQQTPSCPVAPPCGAQTTEGLNNVKLDPIYTDLSRYLYMPGMQPTENQAYPAGSGTAPGWQNAEPTPDTSGQTVPVPYAVSIAPRKVHETPELSGNVTGITALALLAMALCCTFGNKSKQS